MPRIISSSCLLNFLLWQKGDSICDCRVLLFRTVTKMRRVEVSSYGWPLYIRSFSHCKPVRMVSPYLSDCRHCSTSCDNNLLEQGRKKQTPKRCCSPITYLSPWVDLFSPESMEIAAVFLRIVVLESRRLLAPVNFVGYYPAGLALRVQNLTNAISWVRSSILFWYCTEKYSKARLQKAHVF